jgi:putative PIN family toxin of toxin-antitoxin system
VKPLAVVLDTNVIVAAMRSRKGASFQLLSSLGADPRWQAHISTALVLEYTEQVYLNRTDAGWTTQDCEDFLDYVCAAATGCEIFFRWRPHLQDPDDDLLLELAIRANASHIVTFDIHDLSAAESFGIKVVKPSDFLLLLEQQS